MSNVFDVAIIGAGPAGATAALTLARRGARVCLVEAGDGRRLRVGESLPPSVRPLLDSIGVLNRIREGEHLPCHGNCSAWGAASLASTDFLFHPYGHGWHLDRRAFDAMLVRSAEEAGAHVMRSSKYMSASRAEGTWTVGLRAPGGMTSVRARAVVDCSGRRASFAADQGARRVHDDRLVAVVAWTMPSRSGDADSTSLVEAAREGWWYTALLPDGARIFVFHSDGDLEDIQRMRATGGWEARLNETEHVRRIYRTYGYAPMSPPMITLANSSRLTLAAGEGWLAAGDAAAAFDPLSSQGIATALAFGQQAALAVLADDQLGMETAATYAATVQALYDNYQRERMRHYQYERRWPTSPFWFRRMGFVSPPGHLPRNPLKSF